MRKIPFYVALPRATLAQTIGKLSAVTILEEFGGVTYVQSPYGITIWRQLSRSFTYPPQPSDAPTGKWRLWAVQAIGPWRNAAKTYRWLGRRRQVEPGQVLGPWTHAKLVLIVGSRTDDDGNAFADLLGPGLPWVIYGDNPQALATLAYEPTEPEIANDTPADEGTVFP